jgi:hypothetical protein
MARPPKNGNASKQGNRKNAKGRRSNRESAKGRKGEDAKDGRNHIVRENRHRHSFSFFAISPFRDFAIRFLPISACRKMVAFPTA